MRARPLALLFAVCAAVPAWALDPARAPEQYLHRAWTSDDGLPQNTVDAILQDRDGYVWIGTEEGLARFDGAAFTIVPPATSPLEAIVAHALAEDLGGAIWVGTDGDGVLRVDGSVLVTAFAEGPLARAAVRCLAADREGGLWVGTAAGLFHAQAGTIRSFAVTDGPAPQAITACALDADGSLWVGTSDAGLSHWTGGRFEPMEAPAGGAHGWILAIARDPSGTLWLGLHDGVMRLVDGRLERLTASSGAPQEMVTSIIGDRDGNLWFASEGGLVRLFGGQFRRHTTLPGAPYALGLDREGGLWVGTLGRGLHRLADTKFVTWSTREGLSAETVWSVTEDQSGAVWIGTYGGGLDRLLGDGHVDVFGDAEGLVGESAWGLLCDRGGTLWVGTSHGLLWLEDEHLRPVPAVGDVRVTALAEEDGGALLIGTKHSGLVRLERGSARSFTVVDGLPSDEIHALARGTGETMWIGTERGLASWQEGRIERAAPELDGAITALAPQADGSMWIGTDRLGLGRLRDGLLRTVTRRDGLPSDAVFQILADDAGGLWMGNNKGVFRLDEREVEAFFDGAVARVTARAFGRADGMESAECNGVAQPSAVRTRDGRLWFATTNGVAVIDPSRLPRNDVVPPVHVERVFADERPMPIVGGAVRIPADAHSLRIEYSGLSFVAPERVAFRYQLEGFDAAWTDAGSRRAAFYTNLRPGEYRFHVSARNDDGVWNERGATVRLDLRPRFFQTTWFVVLMGVAGLAVVVVGHRVRVGHLARRERELTRVVEERTADLAERNRALDQALESLRAAQTDLVRAEKMASIATLVRGIAHELNNPIGFIAGNVGPLRKYCRRLIAAAGIAGEDAGIGGAMELAPVAADLEKLLEDVAEGARRAQLIIRDLQNLTTGSGTHRSLERVHLAKTVRQSLALLLPRIESRAVKMTTDLDEDSFLTARAGQMDQVCVNLIDNALHAVGSDGRVAIRVAREGDDVVLAVTDNGCGMSEEIRRRACEPFFTTRPAGEGSGLGLAIVASIVGGHRGRMDITSSPEKGTTIVVRVPARELSRAGSARGEG